MALSIETLALAKKFAKSYTDTATEGLANGIKYKGEVNYIDLLPSSPKVGDAYTVKYKGTSQEAGTDVDGGEYVWGKYEGTNQWILFGPDMSQFITASGLKTINNQSLVGSGNIAIVTNSPFPNTWPTDTTIEAFCGQIYGDPTAIPGMSYLGELHCSNFNTLFGISNGDALVQIMDGPASADKAIHIVMTSGSTSAKGNHWEYTYWKIGEDVHQSGWITLQNKLTAGNNISISGNTISATDTTYSADAGLTLTGTTFSVSSNIIDARVDTSRLPTAANTTGIMMFVLAATEPANKYDGYFYIIVS